MPTRPAGLPDFERPPISEVVLSLQFEALSAFRNVHVGLLWAEFRKDYPRVSEHATIDPVFETFGAPKPAQAVRVEAFLTPPMPRFWFEEGREGSELIQIQQDRLLHNWRKRECEYPRYERIRDRFESEVAKFVSFVENEELGTVKVNQCEVTYINLIEASDDHAPYAILDELTPVWTGKGSDDFLPPWDLGNIRASYVLRKGEQSYGRVHVMFSPAIRKTDNKPVIKLEITARGRPESESIDSAFRLLDQHRSTVVRTFASVTTPAMHEVWGRRRNDG